MASWKVNPIMEWSTNGGTSWTLISDHNREPLDISVERIENAQRLANGTLRRYVVAKKRSLSLSWSNIPSKQTSLLTNGISGDALEAFHNNNDGEFLVRLRAGSDRDTTFTGTQGTILTVMITEFSKTINKRGINFDLVDISMTLEEV